MLFADLVGFTQYAAGRDPEDVRDLQSDWFAAAREPIERRGGLVEKFIGDAVMAVWGVPVAREDDAEQACRAGLEVVARLHASTSPLDIRVGIATGEVAASLDAVGEGIVTGDIVNTAARLQSVALPGTVLVDRVTVQVASTVIDFEPAGERVLKGKPAPVQAWRAIGSPGQHRDRDRPGRLVPRFVGRAAEMGALLGELSEATVERRPRLVVLLGEGGVGKSRLAREVRLRLAQATDGPVGWYEAHPDHRDGDPFAAVAEVVRRITGLTGEEDGSVARRRLETALAGLIPDPGDRDWVARAVTPLLGMGPPSGGSRDAMFGGWRVLLERLVADRGPSVFVFEDLHAAPDGLLDFIDHLVAWARDAPILVLGLGRDDLQRRRPAWRAASRTKVIDLQALAPEEVHLLLDDLVTGLPESVADTIVERAGGIALYAVETLRMLVDERLLTRVDDEYRPAPELADIAIPPTLRALIAARLDGAGPARRSLLEDAAVLGPRFGRAALEAVSALDPSTLERRLADLAEGAFLAAIGGARQADETYSFLHPLVREIAYQMLSRPDRRERHLRAASHLGAQGDEELAPSVAAHLLAAYKASRPGPEADELRGSTRVALTAAGERALAMGAPGDALEMLEEALGLAAPPDAALVELAARSAHIAGRHRTAERHVRHAMELRRSTEDVDGWAMAVSLLGTILVGAGRPGEAVPLIEEALQRIPEGDSLPRATLLTALARACFRGGQLAASLDAAEEAVALAEEPGLERLLPEALLNRASALLLLGREDDAIAQLQAAARHALAAGDMVTEMRACNNLSVALGARDIAEGLVVARRGLALAERLGDRQFAVLLTQMIAVGSLFAASDVDAALRDLDERLAGDLEAVDRFQLEDAAVAIRATRGTLGDAEWAAYRALAAEMDDAQTNEKVLLTEAQVAWLACDYAGAVRAGLEAADLIPRDVAEALWGAYRGALWLRDLPALRAIGERLGADGSGGPQEEAVRLSVAAGIAALEGRPDDAIASWDDAIRRWTQIGLAFQAALTALDLVAGVGPERPAARRVAEMARETLGRLHGAPYLERLAALLRDEDTAAGGSSGTG